MSQEKQRQRGQAKHTSHSEMRMLYFNVKSENSQNQQQAGDCRMRQERDDLLGRTFDHSFNGAVCQLQLLEQFLFAGAGEINHLHFFCFSCGKSQRRIFLMLNAVLFQRQPLIRISHRPDDFFRTVILLRQHFQHFEKHGQEFLIGQPAVLSVLLFILLFITAFQFLDFFQHFFRYRSIGIIRFIFVTFLLFSIFFRLFVFVGFILVHRFFAVPFVFVCYRLDPVRLDLDRHGVADHAVRIDGDAVGRQSNDHAGGNPLRVEIGHCRDFRLQQHGNILQRHVDPSAGSIHFENYRFYFIFFRPSQGFFKKKHVLRGDFLKIAELRHKIHRSFGRLFSKKRLLRGGGQQQGAA